MSFRRAKRRISAVCKIKQLQGSFVVPQGGTPQDDSFEGFFRNL
jgi:hypothetical protein